MAATVIGDKDTEAVFQIFPICDFLTYRIQLRLNIVSGGTTEDLSFQVKRKEWMKIQVSFHVCCGG